MNPNALSFAGNGSVVRADAGLTLAAPVTIGMWVKPPVTPAGGAIASRNTGSGDGLRMFINSNGSIALFWEGTSPTATLSKTSTINLVKWGGWNFVAFILGTARLRTYINGKLESTGSDYTSTPTASSGLQVGKNYLGTFFTGLIDKPFISAADLTQAQLDAIYHGNAPIPSSSLEWLFDEGSGSTANDNSGNSRSGVITNATYTTDKPVLGNTSSMFAML